MRRRNFTLWLCGITFASPRVLLAQESKRVRRIAALLGTSDQPPESGYLGFFKKRLAAHGLVDGSNLAVEVRWTRGDAQRAAGYAKELVAQGPQVMLASSLAGASALRRETRSIP